MAVKAGTAYVDIEGDFSALNRQVASHFRRITKDADKAGKRIGRTVGIGMAAGIGATVVAGKQLFDFGKDAVNVASDVNESLSKNQVLFGKYAKGVENFSKRSADAFGISRQSALEYTGTFGNLFTALGVSGKESAKFSRNLVKLSADMASFNNSTPEEALEAIRSGLVGETEPLRRFGVNMNDATLKAQAMKMGLIKSVKDGLTPQQKALAAQRLIFKQTAKAHGDFNKTSDQLANSQRRLQARWVDVKNTLGTALLPAVKNVTTSLLNIADDVQPKVERAVKNIARVFGRKDLSVGEKIQQSWDSLKFEFGPMADQLKQGIEDANVGDKFKDVIEDAAPVIARGVRTVGLKSAEYWWAGFKEAPLWAKVASGGWLATKLGLTGPALKGLMSFIGGGKGGLLSKATPMPVFVTNPGFGLPGGGGPGGGPVPVPGGGKGILGKLKPFAKAAGRAGLVAGAVDLAINLVDAKGNPIVAAVNTAHDLSFGIVPKLDPGAAGKRHLSEFQQDLAKLASSGNIQGLKDMQKEFNEFSKFDAPGGIDEARRDIEDMIEVTRLAKLGVHIEINSKEARDAAKQVSTALERMKSGSSRSVSSLKTNVRLNMRLIKRTMGEDTAAGKEAMTANFNAAIENVKRSMDEGTISVKEGTALIETYMVRSMQNFGFTRKQALRYAKGQDPLTGKNMNAPLVGKQRGGWINMGAASGDSVHAMLERDEYVLNRKAVKRIGKRTLDRLNFGLAPRFQRGGSVTGDTDFLPALLNALRALSGDVGTPIYVQSGRRTVAEQLAQGPSTPQHPVAGPNGPHVRGVAADITPGYSVFGRAAARHGLAFTVMPQEPWHIQLVDTRLASLPNLPATAPKIPAGTVVGPMSSLRQIAQGALNATAAGAQAAVTNAFNSLLPETGEPRAPSGAVTGNGSGLMKRIAAERGWSFADWWSLDARETSHGTNLSNPGSTARLRGQFLSSNWGKYGPGSDPSKNPTMAQQIYSMAAYIGERYGNPTKAWDWWMAHYPPGWYQRGGSVVKRITKLIRKGPLPSGSAINKVVTQIGKTSKKGKLAGGGKTLRKRLLDRIKSLGLPDSVKDLVKHESAVNRFDDLQSHAGTLTDSSAIQAALEDQQAKLGRTLTAAEQDKTILSLLGRVQGKTQIEWLADELGALGSWRNALIRVHITLSDRLQKFRASIEAARKRRDALQKALAQARTKRGHLVDQRKGSKGAKRERLGKQINDIDRDIRVWTLELNALGGSSGIISQLDNKRDLFATALTDANTDLSEVQGSVAAGDKYQQFPTLQGLTIGRMLGTIFDVQNALNTSGISSYRIPPSDSQSPDTADDPSKELLQELLRQANLRTAVSEAQYAVFRNLPFGGFFQQGGTIPGPVGAPRLIVGHGGEVVVPNDASNVPRVYVNFANGMEWLANFVDIRVDNQTRTQGRHSERQLPGRAGVLR
jgi:hypothetical protein